MGAFLDRARLDALDAPTFRNGDPYPWVNPQGLLSEDGYAKLVAQLPDVGMFERVFGKTRKFGQRSHDRYVLEYRVGLELPRAWSDFIDELQGPDYLDFVRRMFGHGGFTLRFHWHYTPGGCSVSPHCDARHKLGSHIFYLNTADDWNPEWGGDTLLLDDGGRFSARSNPEFGDFDRIVRAESLGNWSLLFQRRGNSWHGVEEIQAPEGALRKVFIVVVEKATRLRLGSGLFRSGKSNQ